MGNRIYYGEYSLKHWIELILIKNITLPEYQRSFVWDEKDINRFMNSLKENQFVPPVTIAHYKVQDEKTETNLILDGQQRLTSILLAYLNYFPNKDKFDNSDNELANEDDSADEPSSEKKIIKWTFDELLKTDEKTSSIEKIKNKLASDSRYKCLNEKPIPDEDKFWETVFLGFCFIVPNSEDKTEIQKTFSRTFREINYFGKNLSAMESRRSLYFMNDKYKNYFDGKTKEKDVLCGLTIIDNMQAIKIDFVRYLSIISQYKAQGNESGVLKNYSSFASRESFYADYVSKIVGLEQESHEEKFNGCEMETIFSCYSWEDRFTELREEILILKMQMEKDKKKDKADFESWIEADYHLFGLIYFILFDNKKIKISEEQLFKELEKKIKEKRSDSTYSKSPNRLTNLRARLKESIDIYSKYLIQ